MSTYGYVNPSSKGGKDSIQRPWILVGIVVLFLIWSPFRTALFNGQISSFEEPIYAAVLFSAILGFVMIPTIAKQFKWTSQHDTLKLLIFLLPISYGVSLINAASSYLAVNMLLIMTIYALFFIASSIITQDGALNRILSITLVATSYMIVLFGLLHWLGNGPGVTSLVKWLGVPLSDDGQVYRDAVMVDSNGARLTSVFQYANTYAAYLMAFLFAALYLIGIDKKWWGRGIHSFMLVPIVLSIFLTLSRGGLVLLPVVFVVLLLFLKPHRQIIWIVHLLISGIATILILNPVTELGLQLQQTFNTGQSLSGWAYILVASLISAVLSLAIERWVAPLLEQKLSRLSARKASSFFIPVGGVVLGAIVIALLAGTSAKNILPENIKVRFENINFEQHSVLERITFYKDSAKVIADYPLIGAGGGAWAALYEEYQNNPYTSRQAHSFFMQYAVEVGLIGFVLFMGILIYIYTQYIRSYIRASEEKRESYFLYFIIATSILVHSLMDFNMSYVFIGVLVFIALGAMTAAIDDKPLKRFTWQPKKVRIVFSSIIGVLSLTLLITASVFISAANGHAQAHETAQASNNFNEIIEPLDKALGIRPTHPDYVRFKTSLLVQVYQQTQDDAYFNEAKDLLLSTLEHEPSNRNLWNQLVSVYASKGMEKEIYDIFHQNKERYPWELDWYEEYMKISSRLGYVSLENEQEKNKYLGSTLQALEHIEQGMEHLKTLPKGQLQGDPFHITNKVALYAGQAYFLLGQTQEAHDMMKPHLQADLKDQTNRELMRWYLASVQKLGLKDETNLASLLAADPNEQAQLDSLVNLKLK
ncbi:O-antigen ligase family protein [Paenibacillus agilis]|uniref:O-antigen ligase domain-containing protein n=1 Tax=Paenibacillus agilis TaxID=3020863 RepID=A0A559IPA2_9BACL|nr:O-antigen ligase family protein [Paenibacillus agilis]TVX89410.1 O-antigen ligase domain-containing protein [Paenibacillus agilis]